MVLSHEGCKLRAADLIIAFEEDDDVARYLAEDKQGLDCQDAGEVLALVAADAVSVDSLVSDRRFERRGEPLVERIGWLYVVVPVEQDSPCGWPSRTAC